MNPSVPRILLAALLCPAGAAAVDWDKASKNWKSVEFEDANRRKQTLWYPTEGWLSKPVDGAEVGLIRLSKAADAAHYESRHTGYMLDVSGRVVRHSSLPYRAPVLKNASAPAAMTVKSPQEGAGQAPADPTPFRELEGPVEPDDPLKGLVDPNERLIAQKFHPLELILGDGKTIDGLKLFPMPPEIVRDMRMRRYEPVDAHVAEHRARLAAKAKELAAQLVANAGQSRDGFVKGEDVLLLRVVGGMGQTQAFYAQLHKAVEGKDLKPFVAHWRLFLRQELAGYAAKAAKNEKLHEDKDFGARIQGATTQIKATPAPAPAQAPARGSAAPKPAQKAAPAVVPAKPDTAKIVPSRPAAAAPEVRVVPPPVETPARAESITSDMSPADCQKLKAKIPSITCGSAQ